MKGISTGSRSICSICGEPTARPVRMCSACSKAYDRDANQDGSVIEAMMWAARRARWYAQRRGLPRYNRMRAAMVRHIHAEHGETK